LGIYRYPYYMEDLKGYEQLKEKKLGDFKNIVEEEK
jgi:hypothetical protein